MSDTFLAERNELCVLMGRIANPDRLSDIIFNASMLAEGHLEGTEVFGVILHKTWLTADEQACFDKAFALFKQVQRVQDNVL